MSTISSSNFGQAKAAFDLRILEYSLKLYFQQRKPAACPTKGRFGYLAGQGGEA